MVRSILIAALLLVTPLTHAQELKKGMLVGTHTLTIQPKPGATIEQVVSFLEEKVIPAMEQSRPGWKAYLLKSVRGEKHENFGLLWVIPSAAERDKYYNADGSASDLGKRSDENVQPVMDEFSKLADFSTVYTDWLVY